jgi:hypothetical protein
MCGARWLNSWLPLALQLLDKWQGLAFMKLRSLLLVPMLGVATLLPTTAIAQPYQRTYYSSHRRHVRHPHRDTARRVGVTAAGGAAIGALAGGGIGAGIGAIAGAGAGYLYDRHEKHHGH